MNTFTHIHSDPDVYSIPVPFPNYATSETNCYLIQQDGETLVVDVGAPSAVGRTMLEGALHDLKADPQHTSFFLTHFHMDHVGLLDEVANPSQTVYLSHVDFGRMQRGLYDPWVDQLYKRMLSEGCPAHYRSIIAETRQADRFDADIHMLSFVGEGDSIAVGSATFDVFEVGGHTPGHLALLHRPSGMLFSGDHVLFVISPGVDLQPDRTDSMETYLQSLEKVRNLPYRQLLHSHGPLWNNVEERIDWLAHHHVQRAASALSVIEATPGLSGEELTRLLSWNVPHKTWDDIAPAQQRYISGEGIVILDYLCGLGDIKRTADDMGINRYYAQRAGADSRIAALLAQASQRLENTKA